MYRESPYKQSPLLYRRSYKPGRRQTLTFRPAVLGVAPLAPPRVIKSSPAKAGKRV